MTHHLDNLDDPVANLAAWHIRFDYVQAERLKAYQRIEDLRTKLDQMERDVRLTTATIASFCVERDELEALLKQVKAEARAEQLRADDAEAEVKRLRNEVEAINARRRWEYDPIDAQLVYSVRDLYPHELGKVFGEALQRPWSEELGWKIERLRDACLAVAEAVVDEEVA